MSFNQAPNMFMMHGWYSGRGHPNNNHGRGRFRYRALRGSNYHRQQRFHNYNEFPTHHRYERVPSPPPFKIRKPPSPLPGSEEYRQKHIKLTSALIKQKLNLDVSDSGSTNPVSPEKEIAEVEMYQESLANQLKKKPYKHNSSKELTSGPSTTHLKQVAKESIIVIEDSGSNVTPKKKRLSSGCCAPVSDGKIDVQEIHDRIIKHIANLSYEKKLDFVNRQQTVLDGTLEQIQTQKRLELSRQLREVSQGMAPPTTMAAIIPDFDIKIEQLPPEIMAQLSNILDSTQKELLNNFQKSQSPENELTTAMVATVKTEFPSSDYDMDFKEISTWDQVPEDRQQAAGSNNVRRKIKLKRDTSQPTGSQNIPVNTVVVDDDSGSSVCTPKFSPISQHTATCGTPSTFSKSSPWESPKFVKFHGAMNAFYQSDQKASNGLENEKASAGDEFDTVECSSPRVNKQRGYDSPILSRRSMSNPEIVRSPPQITKPDYLLDGLDDEEVLDYEPSIVDHSDDYQVKNELAQEPDINQDNDLFLSNELMASQDEELNGLKSYAMPETKYANFMDIELHEHDVIETIKKQDAMRAVNHENMYNNAANEHTPDLLKLENQLNEHEQNCNLNLAVHDKQPEVELSSERIVNAESPNMNLSDMKPNTVYQSNLMEINPLEEDTKIEPILLAENISPNVVSEKQSNKDETVAKTATHKNKKELQKHLSVDQEKEVQHCESKAIPKQEELPDLPSTAEAIGQGPLDVPVASTTSEIVKDRPNKMKQSTQKTNTEPLKNTSLQKSKSKEKKKRHPKSDETVPAKKQTTKSDCTVPKKKLDSKDNKALKKQKLVPKFDTFPALEITIKREGDHYVPIKLENDEEKSEHLIENPSVANTVSAKPDNGDRSEEKIKHENKHESEMKVTNKKSHKNPKCKTDKTISKQDHKGDHHPSKFRRSTSKEPVRLLAHSLDVFTQTIFIDHAENCTQTEDQTVPMVCTWAQTDEQIIETPITQPETNYTNESNCFCLTSVEQANDIGSNMSNLEIVEAVQRMEDVIARLSSRKRVLTDVLHKRLTLNSKMLEKNGGLKGTSSRRPRSRATSDGNLMTPAKRKCYGDLSSVGQQLNDTESNLYHEASQTTTEGTNEDDAGGRDTATSRSRNRKKTSENNQIGVQRTLRRTSTAANRNPKQYQQESKDSETEQAATSVSAIEQDDLISAASEENLSVIKNNSKNRKRQKQKKSGQLIDDHGDQNISIKLEEGLVDDTTNALIETNETPGRTEFNKDHLMVDTVESEIEKINVAEKPRNTQSPNRQNSNEHLHINQQKNVDIQTTSTIVGANETSARAEVASKGLPEESLTSSARITRLTAESDAEKSKQMNSTGQHSIPESTNKAMKSNRQSKRMKVDTKLEVALDNQTTSSTRDAYETSGAGEFVSKGLTVESVLTSPRVTRASVEHDIENYKHVETSTEDSLPETTNKAKKSKRQNTQMKTNNNIVAIKLEVDLDNETTSGANNTLETSQSAVLPTFPITTINAQIDVEKYQHFVANMQDSLPATRNKAKKSKRQNKRKNNTNNPPTILQVSLDNQTTSSTINANKTPEPAELCAENVTEESVLSSPRVTRANAERDIENYKHVDASIQDTLSETTNRTKKSKRQNKRKKVDSNDVPIKLEVDPDNRTTFETIDVNETPRPIEFDAGNFNAESVFLSSSRVARAKAESEILTSPHIDTRTQDGQQNAANKAKRSRRQNDRKTAVQLADNDDGPTTFTVTEGSTEFEAEGSAASPRIPKANPEIVLEDNHITDIEIEESLPKTARNAAKPKRQNSGIKSVQFASNASLKMVEARDDQPTSTINAENVISEPSVFESQALIFEQVINGNTNSGIKEVGTQETTRAVKKSKRHDKRTKVAPLMDSTQKQHGQVNIEEDVTTSVIRESKPNTIRCDPHSSKLSSIVEENPVNVTKRSPGTNLKKTVRLLTQTNEQQESGTVEIIDDGHTNTLHECTDTKRDITKLNKSGSSKSSETSEVSQIIDINDDDALSNCTGELPIIKRRRKADFVPSEYRITRRRTSSLSSAMSDINELECQTPLKNTGDADSDSTTTNDSRFVMKNCRVRLPRLAMKSKH